MEPFSRRQLLRMGGATVVGVGLTDLTDLISRPAPELVASKLATSSVGFLDDAQRNTLAAAVSQLIPASGPGDWSAADIGVVDYIDNLLSGFSVLDADTGAIYPGGPYRLSSISGPETGTAPGPPDVSGGPGFYRFQALSRVKKIGWETQVNTWRSLYASGLAGLDISAGGSFAGASSAEQILILEGLDSSGSAFFGTLFDHTMEGAYSHPVYGGNVLPSGADPEKYGIAGQSGYAPTWQWLGFGGDVHGVRFSNSDSQRSSTSPWLETTNPGPRGAVAGQGSWNIFGGYAPKEMAAAGPNPPTTDTPVPPTQW